MLFSGEYSFRGSHAEKVTRLTAPFDKKNNKLFQRNLDVYLLAPIVGFLYSRTAKLDRGTETKIFPQQLLNEQTSLWFSYRLIMLLDKKHEPNFDERVNRAFRTYSNMTPQSPESLLYESYVRGGVDVLYEKLIAPAKTEEDYLKNLYDFMEEFEDRYGQSSSEIVDLCRLARS